MDSAPVEKGSDRGRRGKGRGTQMQTWARTHCSVSNSLLMITCVHARVCAVSGGRGRGRAPGASRFTAQGMGSVLYVHASTGLSRFCSLHLRVPFHRNLFFFFNVQSAGPLTQLTTLWIVARPTRMLTSGNRGPTMPQMAQVRETST